MQGLFLHESFFYIEHAKIPQELRYKDNNVNGLNDVVNNFGSDFDIIIEDGGHTMLQQQVTLGFMFKNLKSGGLFVIEDLHTSYFAPFAYNKTNTKNTTLNMLQEYINHKVINSDFITEEEKEYLLSNIKEMKMYKGNHSEIVFIVKK